MMGVKGAGSNPLFKLIMFLLVLIVFAYEISDVIVHNIEKLAYPKDNATN